MLIKKGTAPAGNQDFPTGRFFGKKGMCRGFAEAARYARTAVFAGLLLAEGCFFGPSAVLQGEFRAGSKFPVDGKGGSIIFDHCFIGLMPGKRVAFVGGAELHVSGSYEPLRLTAGQDTTITINGSEYWIRCISVSQDLKTARIEIYK